MIPFKNKPGGTVKSTAILLILLCNSQSCLGFLQEEPGRVEVRSDKSRMSRVNHQRRSLENVRDVRADSRQSRIDARDIRTDFREIRSELRREMPLRHYGRQESRVRDSRREMRDDSRSRSVNNFDRRLTDFTSPARDDSQREMRVDSRQWRMDTRDFREIRSGLGERDRREMALLRVRGEREINSFPVRDARVDSRVRDSRREIRVDSRSRSLNNFNRRLMDDTPFARAIRDDSRRENRADRRSMETSRLGRAARDDSRRETRVESRREVRQPSQSRSVTSRIDSRREELRNIRDRRSMEPSRLIRDDSRRELLLDSRENVQPVRDVRQVRRSRTFERGSPLVRDSRREVRDNERRVLENSEARQNVPHRFTTSSARIKSTNENRERIQYSRFHDSRRDLERSEARERIQPRNYRFADSRRDVREPIAERRETLQRRETRDERERLMPERRSISREQLNSRSMDSRRETRESVRSQQARQRVEPLQDEIYSQTMFQRQLRDSVRGGESRGRQPSTLTRDNRGSSRRECETREAPLIRQSRGQYDSSTAVRSDINNNLVENFRRVDGRRFDPFENVQKFQRRTVEIANQRRGGVKSRENIREDAEKLDLTKLANATFIPQDKMNALVNAVQAILVTFLLGGILKNTSQGKLGWMNLRSVLPIKEKLF